MRIFTAIILSVIALLWTISFADIFSIGNISLNVLVLLIYFFTFYWNHWYGLLAGFFLGLCYGAFFYLPLGSYSLIFLSIVLGLILIERRIYKYKYISLLLLFIATFFFGFVEVLLKGINGKWIIIDLFTDVLPESILTALLGMGILYLVNRHR